MADGLSFKEEMQNEKTKWKQMNFRQRWQYFKDYYMIITVAIVLAVIGIVCVVKTVVKNSREVLLSGYFLNVNADQSFYTKLDEDYFSYKEGDEKNQQITLATEQYINPDPDSYSQADAAEKAKFMATVSDHLADYLVLDSTAYEEWGGAGVFEDLSGILTEEQMEEYSSYITEITTDNGETYPAGIRLSDTELAEKYNLTAVYGDGSVYLVFAVGGPNQEDMADFLDYLFR